MKIDSSDKQNKEKEFAPIINLKFLKILVIALGLSILFLIFTIVFKVMNGDLKKDNPMDINTQNSIYSEFKLELPNVKSIKSIDWDGGDIFIIIDDNISLKLVSIDDNNKLKVIKIINSKDIKYTKLK